MRELKTNKLFYNKWPFKVETYIKGASKVYYNGVYDVIEWAANRVKQPRWESDVGFWGRKHNSGIDKIELGKYALAVEPYLADRKDIKVRCEGSHLNLFTDDKDLLEKIRADLYPWIMSITSPSSDEELAFLIDNGHKKVLCNKLPWDKYQYKVFFKNSFETTQRSNFYTWTDRYGAKIEIADSTDRWLQGKKYYVQDPFIYVEDSKMLSMVLLYLGNNVKKVQEFILRNSINT